MMFFLNPDDIQPSYIICGECLGWGVAQRCWYVLSTDSYNCLMHGPRVMGESVNHLHDYGSLT